MGQTKKQGELAKGLLAEYPTANALTLAKRLNKDHPNEFPSIEHARRVIRYYKGSSGTHARRKLIDLTHVKDLDKVLADKFALPEAAVLKREPYILPKFNDKIIIFGDSHFPYENNVGILKAIGYGIKKEVNTIILNGDMIDCYQDSRFSKDARKPNIEYELELFYDFLINLRDVFKNCLIIWKFGNHEERWDAYLKNNAPLHYMVGTERLEDYLPIGDLGIQVVRDKRRIVAGDLNILHGHEFGGGAGQVNPARTMFLKARANVLCGHFHRSSSHKGLDLNGGTIRAYSLGAMCAPQDYSPYGDQDCSFGYLVTIDGKTWVQNREV